MELNNKQLEIIAVSKALFAQNGFEATSVRDIAQHAQVNVAMINYYFTSKENLLQTIVQHGIECYKLQPEKYNQEVDPFLRLEKMAANFVDSKFEDIELYQILENEVKSKKRDGYAQLFRELREYNFLRLKEVIEYGCEQRVFRYYDPMLLLTTMVGSFMHFKMNKVVIQETLSLPSGTTYESYLKEELTRHLKFILKAILTYEVPLK